MRAEKDTLLSEQNVGVQSFAEETEKLLSAVRHVTAERDQLKMDLQENVEMVSCHVPALLIRSFLSTVEPLLFVFCSV